MRCEHIIHGKAAAYVPYFGETVGTVQVTAPSLLGRSQEPRRDVSTLRGRFA